MSLLSALSAMGVELASAAAALVGDAACCACWQPSVAILPSWGPSGPASMDNIGVKVPANHEVFLATVGD